MKKVAVRNIRLCTKDCLCLYVCPVGATDTENSIIDVNKCIGCGDCADACPSKAISMVPVEYPAQQRKTKEVVASLNLLIKNKCKEERIADEVSKLGNDTLYRLMQAVKKSTRLQAEDLVREGGYMLPQSKNTRELLLDLINNPPTIDFPRSLVLELLKEIKCNEEE